MNEFFAAVYTEDPDSLPAPDTSSYTSSFADLPLSSPDSITVTTEFGVLEETGNVTIISAGGATHPYDDGDAYDDLAYHHLNLHPHDEGPESYVVMTEDTSLPHASTPVPGPSDWVAAVALQHHHTQNAWLLQQHMQSMYHAYPNANPNPSLNLNSHASHHTPPHPSLAPGSSSSHTPPVPLHQQLQHQLQHQHQHPDLSTSSDELDLDGGEEADIDTDEILDDDEEAHAAGDAGGVDTAAMLNAVGVGVGMQ